MIGRETSNSTSTGSGLTTEDSAWVGKPWRRIELVTRRYFWQGAQHSVERDLTFHLGLRRFGLFATVIMTRQPGYDYSEERP